MQMTKNHWAALGLIGAAVVTPMIVKKLKTRRSGNGVHGVAVTEAEMYGGLAPRTLQPRY